MNISDKVVGELVSPHYVQQPEDEIEEKLYMIFEEESSEEQHKIINEKFWGRLTQIITGPEHQRVILTKLIDKIKFFREEEAK